MEFVVLRLILGAFCVLFAPALGSSLVRFRQGRERQSRMLTWALRVVVTGAVVSFRTGFDRVTMIVYSLALLAFLAGAYFEWRPKHDEELEKVMFPRE